MQQYINIFGMNHPTESQEQQRLALKLRWLYPNLVFFAVPNGGRRNRGEAHKMTLEGVEKGTPDLFIAEPNEDFHGLFIELKRANESMTKVSPEQEDKMVRLREKGYCVRVCYGAEEAMKEISLYLENKKVLNFYSRR